MVTKKQKLHEQAKYINWQQDNPDKGFTDYLRSLGSFKDVPLDATWNEEEKVWEAYY